MLVLSRKVGQAIRINENIVVTLLRVHGKLSLAIEAPREISVVREEVHQRGQDAASEDPAA